MGSLRQFVTLLESLQPSPRGDVRPYPDIRLDDEPDACQTPDPDEPPAPGQPLG